MSNRIATQLLLHSRKIDKTMVLFFIVQQEVYQRLPQHLAISERPLPDLRLCRDHQLHPHREWLPGHLAISAELVISVVNCFLSLLVFGAQTTKKYIFSRSVLLVRY